MPDANLPCRCERGVCCPDRLTDFWKQGRAVDITRCLKVGTDPERGELGKSFEVSSNNVGTRKLVLRDVHAVDFRF